MRGVIFEDVGVGSDDMSKRIPGTQVAASGGGNSGSDVAAAPDADWLIALAPGTYTVTATAVGYYENVRVCTVTSGQTTWCSIGLFEKTQEPPPPATGVLRGVVYEDQGVGDQDMSVRLAGAMITVQGEDGDLDMATASSPNADWQFTVPVGKWTVNASSPGYWMNTRICEVTSGGETWCSLGLFTVDEDPPLDPPIPSDGPKGTLLGAIFEEQGSGTADMSIRLPGASVKAMGALGTEFVVTDGEWGLYDMSLPPGVYEVTAALDGYWPNVRLCSVAANTETWCSLGLWTEDEQPPEDPTPGYGGAPVNGDVGGDDTPPWDPEQEDPENPNPDLPQPEDPGTGWEVPEGDIGTGTEGGCTTTPTGTGAGTLLLLLVAAGLLTARRKPLGAIVACATLLVFPAALAEEGDGRNVVDIHAVTDGGGHEQPVWSPDGARLAFAGERFSKVLVVSADGGPTRLLAEGVSVGYEPVWSPDSGAVEHRHQGQRSCAVPVSSVTLERTRGPAPAHRHAGQWVRVRDDQVHLRSGRTERRISRAGDRYCCTATAPDGGAVAFMGLTSGIHVHDVATGRTVALGAGAHPRFSADGTRLVFDRCVDDGDVLTTCTLWMADLTVATPTLHEIRGVHPMARHPALSPDGTHIAYDTDGRIWVGRLE